MAYLHTNYPESCADAGLSAIEYVMLTTVRLWVAHHNEVACASKWDEGLQIAGLSAATITEFNRFAVMLATASWSRLEFHSPGCECIGNDEGLFLEVVALLQFKQFEAATEILEHWLPPAAVRIAVTSAAAIANGLLAGGLLLPLRERQKGGPHHHLPIHACHQASNTIN